MRRHCTLLLISVVVASFVISGCGASKKAAERDTIMSELDAARKKLDALSSENSQLKQQLNRLEQENRNLIAKTAQLETLLEEERSKEKSPTVNVVPPPPKEIITSVDIEYQAALSLYKQRKYSEAAKKLQSILNARVSDELADNCHYWLGESYFGMKDYRNAISSFEKVFNYKVSEKKDDAAIMIANCYWEMGNKKEAIKEYKKFLEKFPASPYVKRAKARISEQ